MANEHHGDFNEVIILPDEEEYEYISDEDFGDVFLDHPWGEEGGGDITSRSSTRCQHQKIVPSRGHAGTIIWQ